MYIIICEMDRQSRFDAWDRALRAGALGRPWGMGWGGRWEGGSGWGTHVPPWLIHVSVWQKPLQYCKVIQFNSVTQSCPTLCDPVNHSTPGLPVHHQLPESMSVMPSNHLILCHILLLPSIFPSIRIFSNESVLCIWWAKYWSFSFSISPSNEYSGLIPFRMDWFDLLAIQGTLKSLLHLLYRAK